MKNIKIGLLLLFTILFSSCSFEFLSSSHEHVFSTQYSITDGQHYRQCTVEGCKEKIEQEAHTYGEWIITKEPTHEERGMRESSCLVCGRTAKVDLERGHRLEYVEKLEPTCTENGYKDHYRCIECEEIFADSKAKYSTSLRELQIEKKGHEYQNGEITYYKPTLTECGSIEINCKNCESLLTVEINPLDYQSDYVTVIVPPTCTENGSITYRLKEQAIVKSLDDLIEDYSPIIARIRDLGVFDEETYITNSTGHMYGASYYSGSYSESFIIAIRCQKCREPILTNDGKEFIYIGEYDPSLPLFEEVSNPVTCKTPGYIKYKVNPQTLLQVYLDNYSVSDEIIQSCVDTISSNTFSFYYEDNNHQYEERYRAPTYDKNGVYSIQCKICDKYYTNKIGGTEPTPIVLPSVAKNDTLYELKSTTTYCDKEGFSVYGYNEEVLRERLKFEYDFALTDEDIEKYVTILDDEIIKVEKPIRHVFDDGSPVLVAPTLENEGYIYYRCLRDGCDAIMTSTYGDLDKIVLPPLLSGNTEVYTINRIDNCFEPGELTYSINQSWYEKEASSFGYGSSYGNCVTSDKAFFETLQNRKVELEPLGYHQSIDKVKIVDDVMEISCSSCNEVIMNVNNPPQKGDSCLTTTYSPPIDCIFREHTYYHLSKEKALELIEGNEIFLTPTNDTYEKAAQLLTKSALYDEVGKPHPTIHGQPSVNGYSHVAPTFNNKTLATTSAIINCKCKICQKEYQETVSYSDCTWSYNSEGTECWIYAYAGYKIDYSFKSTTRSYWNFYIDLENGRITASSSQFTDINFAVNKTLKNYIDIEKDAFDVNGNYSSVKNINVFIDGSNISNETLVEQGRLEIHNTYYRIYMATDKNGNRLPGDVHVKLVF